VGRRQILHGFCCGPSPLLALGILVACLLWVLVRSSPIETESIALHVFDIHLYQTLILHRALLRASCRHCN